MTTSMSLSRDFVLGPEVALANARPLLSAARSTLGWHAFTSFVVSVITRDWCAALGLDYKPA